MNNSFTKSISYLTEEETAQFNELMSLNFPEYKYFDLKIDPIFVIKNEENFLP